MADAMRRLVDLFRQLPGVGEKTAGRMIFAILAAPIEYGQALGQAIQDLVQQVHPCERCGNLAETPLCPICSDTRRDAGLLCVVERVPDLLAIESSHTYRGRYHVLGGVLNPLGGIGPDALRIASLLSHLPGEVKEVILATSNSVEGEATALYLKTLISRLGVRVTRIASGIPVGGELEYVDRSTLGKALTGRRDMDS